LNQYRLIPTTHYHQVAIPQMKIEHVSPQLTPQVEVSQNMTMPVKSKISEYRVDTVQATSIQTTQNPIINLISTVPASKIQASKITSKKSDAKATSNLVSLATVIIPKINQTRSTPVKLQKTNSTTPVSKRSQPTPAKLQKNIITPKRQILTFEINICGLLNITADALQVPADTELYTYSTNCSRSTLSYLTETVHSKCGPELRKSLEAFRFQKPGASVPTNSFEHKLVKKIIHSVPPDKFELDSNTKELDSKTLKEFKNCYTTALDLANNLKLDSIIVPLLLKQGKMKEEVRRQMSIYKMWEAIAEWFQKKNMFIGDRCYVPMDTSLQKVIFSFEPQHPDMKKDTMMLREMLIANNIVANFVTTNGHLNEYVDW